MDIIGKRRWFFIMSAVIIVIGVVFLAVFKLRMGIEFDSGSMMRLSFEQPVEQGQLESELTSLGYVNAVVQYVQNTDGKDYYIRTADLDREEKQGLQAALERKKRLTPPRKKIIDGEQEARIIALSRTTPPPGRAKWSLRLLADKIVELKIVESASHMTVQRVLKKTNSSLT